MNSWDRQLDRLLKAAAQAPATASPSEAPYGLATRLRAQSNAATWSAEYFPSVALLRGVLICSAVVLFLSLSLAYQSFETPDVDELAIANSVLIQLTMNP